jgi:hypothetical protein
MNWPERKALPSHGRAFRIQGRISLMSKPRRLKTKRRLSPTAEMVGDGQDIFIVVEGVRIAKRGHPGTPQAKSWISLEPGWTVMDSDYPNSLIIEFNGVRVQ